MPPRPQAPVSRRGASPSLSESWRGGVPTRPFLGASGGTSPLVQTPRCSLVLPAVSCDCVLLASEPVKAVLCRGDVRGEGGGVMCGGVAPLSRLGCFVHQALNRTDTSSADPTRLPARSFPSATADALACGAGVMGASGESASLRTQCVCLNHEARTARGGGSCDGFPVCR